MTAVGGASEEGQPSEEAFHVASELLDSSTQFARSSLEALAGGGPRVALLHAATALEQLAKAFLAARHPSLIADAKNFDSLLHACGETRHARTPPTHMKTITARDAVERSSRMIPSLRDVAQGLQLLIDVRNGVVHLGSLESMDIDGLLLPFFRAATDVLVAMERDPTSYWGDFAPMVEARLSESAREAEVRTADAIAVARRGYEERFRGMDKATREAVVEVIVGTYAPEKYEETLEECPACKNTCLLSGIYDVRWEPEVGVEGGEAYVSGAYPVVSFRPGHLECRVCALELDGEEELQAAGFPEEWDLEEEVDPTDFIPDDEWAY